MELIKQSEEDQQLKAELEMLVERLKESDTGLYLPALESLRTLIKTSTSSMTSVPKPLKFLRPHYEEMGGLRDGWAENLTEQRVSYRSSSLSDLACPASALYPGDDMSLQSSHSSPLSSLS
jgi:26S proteasome regulatory subunit N1